ncbi:hypothetical protein [Desulfobulbus elongatus]|uniref:hypothetical protein n=1 Tax=Desulfobulbus elongatus TaxID=53332 RepID=UPI000A92C1E6|nr:hypothetical protein [Desulfobulbus elongatus]
MRDNVFWAMFGFLIGVCFLAAMQGSYERPTKWEDGGVIVHKGQPYKLQILELSGDKR